MWKLGTRFDLIAFFGPWLTVEFCSVWSSYHSTALRIVPLVLSLFDCVTSGWDLLVVVLLLDGIFLVHRSHKRVFVGIADILVITQWDNTILLQFLNYKDLHKYHLAYLPAHKIAIMKKFLVFSYQCNISERIPSFKSISHYNDLSHAV